MKFLHRLGKFPRDMFMGPNNLYWDYGRVILFAGNLVLFAGVGFNVFHLKEAFDPTTFATAFGILNGPMILANSFRDKNTNEILKDDK